MFPQDLDDYGARETLAALADVHDLQGQADLAELRLALHLADLHPDPATLSGQVAMPGGERGIVYGGAGCPAVAEFAPAEFGAVTGRSTGAAATFLGQALALRHRLSRTWAQVLSGHATAWKARKIATACLELSEEAAAIVDARVADIVDSVTPLRLANIVKAAMWQADPEVAKARAEERARKRGVWAGRSDEYGTTMLFVRASSGDVIRFKATVDQVADALAALGDTDSKQQRRAKALGVLADPAMADKLLQVAHHLTSSAAQMDAPADTAADATADATGSVPADTASDASGGGADRQATDAPAQEARAWGTPPSALSDEPSRASGNEPSRATDEPRRLHADESVRAESDEPRRMGGDAPGRADSDEPTHAPATRPALAPAPDAERPPEGCEHQPQGEYGQPVDGPNGPTGHGPQDDAYPDDSPHPSDPAFDDYLPEPSHPFDEPWSSDRPDECEESDRGMDWAARRELAKKLDAIRQVAHTGRRPRQTVLYAHITDEVLLAGQGVARVEGYGPVYVDRLHELLGHDSVVIQPVIDLNVGVSVDAYEIPRRIREQVKLTSRSSSSRTAQRPPRTASISTTSNPLIRTDHRSKPVRRTSCPCGDSATG